MFYISATRAEWTANHLTNISFIMSAWMLNVAVHHTLLLKPSHITSFMSVPDLVNISVPNPPLCQTKLSLQLDLHGALVPIPTAVTKSLCTGLVPTKHGAVLIHAANVLLSILVLSKTLCFFFFINCFLIFRMEEKPKPKVPMPGSCLDDPISRSLRGDPGSGDSERKAEPSAPNYSRRFSPAAVEQHQIRMSGTLNCSKVFPSSKYPSKTSLFALEV